LVNEALKVLFHRLRPEAWFGYTAPTNYSFPSGHAFVSCCFFLCMAEVLIQANWPLGWKVATWVAASACTFTIGLSRVYLGVHYPSDVIGGFAAAIVWTTIIRIAHHMRQQRTLRLVG